jgi:hypothetical protein
MARADGVEFVSDDGAPLVSEDDVIALGRGGLPRWVSVLLVGIVVAAVIAAVMHARHPAPSIPDGAAAIAVTPEGLGTALPIGPTAAVDVAVFGGHIYALQVGRLAEIDLGSKRLVAQTPITGFDDGPALRLVPDAARGRIWVITVGVDPAMIAEFDARTLAPLRSTSWDAAIGTAAILNGHLYFAAAGVADWAPGAAQPQLVPGLAREKGPIAADPARRRLLLLRIGESTRIYSYRPGGALQGGTALAITKGQLTVSNGTIWLAGFAVTGAPVVARVDPVSLRAGTNDDVVVDLGLGALFAGEGQDVVWLRNGSGTGSLWCVDARDGRVLNNWADAPGAVASVQGAGFIATGTAVLSLTLGRCPG